MPMLSTVMNSQSMQSIYTSLIPAQKINFLCSPIEICAGEDCFDSGTDFLSQKSYSAVYLYEMAQKEYFLDLQ